MPLGVLCPESLFGVETISLPTSFQGLLTTQITKYRNPVIWVSFYSEYPNWCFPLLFPFKT